MHRKVAFFKVTTATGQSYRPETTRAKVWQPWAEIFTQASARKPDGLDVLQEGDLAFEVRRCKLAVEIWQEITAHTATYEVELDGRAYTITSADFTRRDDAKVAFRASAAG